jgi:hypothetical protein
MHLLPADRSKLKNISPSSPALPQQERSSDADMWLHAWAAKRGLVRRCARCVPPLVNGKAPAGAVAVAVRGPDDRVAVSSEWWVAAQRQAAASVACVQPELGEKKNCARFAFVARSSPRDWRAGRGESDRPPVTGIHRGEDVARQLLRSARQKAPRCLLRPDGGWAIASVMRAIVLWVVAVKKWLRPSSSSSRPTRPTTMMED